MRAALQLALEQWALERAGLLEEEPYRRGHRVRILQDAIAPLATDMPAAVRDRLHHALSVIYGIEPWVVLKDIWGLPDREVERVALWMADALIDAALREAQQRHARRGSSDDPRAPRPLSKTRRRAATAESPADGSTRGDDPHSHPRRAAGGEGRRAAAPADQEVDRAARRAGHRGRMHARQAGHACCGTRSMTRPRGATCAASCTVCARPACTMRWPAATTRWRWPATSAAMPASSRPRWRATISRPRCACTQRHCSMASTSASRRASTIGWPRRASDWRGSGARRRPPRRCGSKPPATCAPRCRCATA